MKFLLVPLLLATFASAADTSLPGDLDGERLVAFGEGAQRQVYGDLVIGNCPHLHSRIIYSRRGLIPTGSRGVVLLYPGTGARIDSEYGLERSVAQIVNALVKRNYAVLAFQPPLYFQPSDEASRAPFLKEYANLESNLLWLLRTIDFAGAHTLNAKIPTHIMARSTFGAVTLQALHELGAGDERFRPLSDLETVFVIGTTGHQPHEIAGWWKKEEEFFGKKENASKNDLPVRLATRALFEQMTFSYPTASAFSGVRLPRLFASVASRDLWSGPIENLFSPLVGFHGNHPNTDMTIFWHDGHHNPAAEILENKTVLAPTMARMNPMLDRIYSQPGLPQRPGLRLAYVPSKELVHAPLSVESREACGRVLVDVDEDHESTAVPVRAKRPNVQLRPSPYMLEP